MKRLAKRLVFATFIVLGALSVIAMVAPNQSAAAPIFRPVMPMHQATPAPAATHGVGIGQNRITQSPQISSGFLGNNPAGAFRMGALNSQAVFNGMTGFSRLGPTGSFGSGFTGNGFGFNGVATGFGFNGFAASQIGFNGFATGLGALQFAGLGFGGGFSSPSVGFSSGFGAMRTPGFGAANPAQFNPAFGLGGVGALNGFTNLNGFNNFSPGAKIGFNGFNGL